MCGASGILYEAETLNSLWAWVDNVFSHPALWTPTAAGGIARSTLTPSPNSENGLSSGREEIMEQLPEELLEQVLTHLQPSLEKPYWISRHEENKGLSGTLATFCQVSKTCSRVATPMLYDTIELFYHRDEREDGSKKYSGYETNLLPLLRTCLCKPDLALQIKKLRVRARGSHAVKAARKSRSHRILPSGYYEPVLQDFSISTDLRLMLLSGLDRDLEDASLAILFYLCQSLHTREYTPGRDGHLVLVKRTMLELAKKGFQYPLHRLHTFAIYPPDGSWSGESTYSTDGAPFLYGSSLRTVKAFAYRGMPVHPDSMVPNSVTRLQLHQPQFITTTDAEALFTCFPSLRDLHLSMISAPDDEYRTTVASGLNCVADALRSHGASLESLTIIVSNTILNHMCIVDEDFSWDGDAVRKLKASLGDLRSLTRLRGLTTTGMALLQHQHGRGFVFKDGDARVRARLPPSLEMLRIVRPREDSEHVGPEGEGTKGAHHEQYRELLRDEILQLCCADGFERLRCIEVEGFSTLEGDADNVGWAMEDKGNSIVLTR